MNTAHGAFKLSIRRIVCDTFLIPWRHKRAFITPLILPGLLMAVITLGWLLTRGKMPEAASWLLFGVYWVSFGIFAVACHRLVLLGPSPTTLAVRLTLGLREIRFIVWLALIGVIYALVYFLSVLGILNSLLLGETITGAHASKMGQAHINAAQYVALVVATFVFARFSLILPAVALDQKVSLHWAWQRSEHNGWRLAVTIGVFPPVLEIGRAHV